jgi:hypothetical protein
VFEIPDAELAYANAYAVAAYLRDKALLASGLEAWVDVDARGKPPGPSASTGEYHSGRSIRPPQIR